MVKTKTNIDKCNNLIRKFQEEHRYANFGNILIRTHVQGVRCHINTVIEIKNPITAFCGLNGVGKSTLIQLFSAAYRGEAQQETYYISDFINAHKLDPTPFSDEAKIEYSYWQENKMLKQLTVSRKHTGGWQGYNRRLKRKVLYIGVSSYLPKVEKADFINRNLKGVTLINSLAVEKHIKEWTCKVLGKNYEVIETHTFKFKKRIEEINSVQHNHVNYSEQHMGYGEARTQYLIRTIESLPDKSLVLIEEPEMSLHPSAQYQIGCYLVDVILRKGHQIFLSTHSESLLSALPSQSRKYLEKTQNGIQCISGLPPSQAHSLMSDGHSKALSILVEDKNTKSTAKAILSEIIRCVDSLFLSSVGIYPSGDCNTVKSTVKTVCNTNLKVAGVLDADQEPILDENIFVLPGNLAPEKELFNNQKVKDHIQSQYHLNLDDFQSSCLIDVDHHYWFEKLAKKLTIEESALVTEVSKVYVSSLSENSTSTLVNQLKEACN